MAEKIEIKAFRIKLSKDEKQKIRDKLIEFHKDIKLRAERDSLTTILDEYKENIADFIESLIIDNVPDIPF